jgi:putative transposase
LNHAKEAAIILPGVPLHLIQRENNRQACFYSDKNYLVHLELLKEYAEKCSCQNHAYVLMTNHVHLLITPETPASAGDMMKRIGQRYVQYVNRTYRHSGTLWEERFRSCLMMEEDYVLGCYRYIALNPVRANMMIHPAEYRWSNYRSNAKGEKSKLLTSHYHYKSLGRDEVARQASYRELFRYQQNQGSLIKYVLPPMVTSRLAVKHSRIM